MNVAFFQIFFQKLDVDAYNRSQIRTEFRKRNLACPHGSLQEMKNHLQQIFDKEKILHTLKQWLLTNKEIIERASNTSGSGTTIPNLKNYINLPQFKEHLANTTRKGRNKQDYTRQLLALCQLHKEDVNRRQIAHGTTIRQELITLFGTPTVQGNPLKTHTGPIESPAPEVPAKRKRTRSTADLKSIERTLRDFLSQENALVNILSLNDEVLIQSLLTHFKIPITPDITTIQDRCHLIYTHLLNTGQCKTTNSIRPAPAIVRVKAFEITKILHAAKTMGFYSVMKYYHDHQDALSTIEDSIIEKSALLCTACNTIKKAEAFTANQKKNKGNRCRCNACVSGQEQSPDLIVHGFPAAVISQIVRGVHPNTPSLYERFQELASADFIEASNNMLPDIDVYNTLEYAVADYANRSFSVDLCTMQYRTCGCCNAFNISSGLLSGLKSSAYNHTVKRRKFVYYNETTRQYIHAGAKDTAIKNCVKIDNVCNHCVKHLQNKHQPKFDGRNCFHAGIPVPDWVEQMTWSEIACCTYCQSELLFRKNYCSYFLIIYFFDFYSFCFLSSQAQGSNAWLHCGT